MKIFRRRCAEYVYPEMRFPSCQCTRKRGHDGAHRDKSGDTWEGPRR